MVRRARGDGILGRAEDGARVHGLSGGNAQSAVHFPVVLLGGPKNHGIVELAGGVPNLGLEIFRKVPRLASGAARVRDDRRPDLGGFTVLLAKFPFTLVVGAKRLGHLEPIHREGI